MVKEKSGRKRKQGMYRLHRPIMKLNKIEIIWRDTSSLDNEWNSLEKCIEQAKIKFNQKYSSIGYLIEKNKDFYLIASSCDGDEERVFYNDLIMFPTTNVLDIKKL